MSIVTSYKNSNLLLEEKYQSLLASEAAIGGYRLSCPVFLAVYLGKTQQREQQIIIFNYGLA